LGHSEASGDLSLETSGNDTEAHTHVTRFVFRVSCFVFRVSDPERARREAGERPCPVTTDATGAVHTMRSMKCVDTRTILVFPHNYTNAPGLLRTFHSLCVPAHAAIVVGNNKNQKYVQVPRSRCVAASVFSSRVGYEELVVRGPYTRKQRMPKAKLHNGVTCARVVPSK